MDEFTGTNALFHDRTGALNDEKILELLRKMPEMYENGELSEVQDICLSIYQAIDEFAKEDERRNG